MHVSLPWLLILSTTSAAAPAPADNAADNAGSIEGIVVNASSGSAPVPRVEVLLQARVQGEFVPVAETAADRYGRFQFDNLPLGADIPYLPGATKDDVHYPGARVQLTAAQPYARVRIVVHNAVAAPSPLVARRHEIVVRPESGGLKVTETLLIDNPSNVCYVGQAAHDAGPPVTLRLSVPPGFERITFQEEFFGRRFLLVNDRLVTSVPWPPGKREMKFTYTVANQQRRAVWSRPLDLPCADLQLTVYTDDPDHVSSNLEPAPGADGQVRFASRGTTLPAGHVVQLELGHLPVPMMAYGRWLALAALSGLVLSTGLVAVRRGRRVHPAL